MKKKITLLLLLSLIISALWGCGNKSPTGDLDFPEITGDRFVYAAKMYGKLIRYDVIDKKL